MVDTALNTEIITNIKTEVPDLVCSLMGRDIIKIVLYGSCSRGDFTDDSDIDIALFTRCGRQEVKKYNTAIASLSTDFAMKYLSIVNFVCLPYTEFLEKKGWYPYFKNIDVEGEILYG